MNDNARSSQTIIGTNDLERMSVSSKKVIDMEIIDRIKNMRSKSRDNNKQ